MTREEILAAVEAAITSNRAAEVSAWNAAKTDEPGELCAHGREHIDPIAGCINAVHETDRQLCALRDAAKAAWPCGRKPSVVWHGMTVSEIVDATGLKDHQVRRKVKAGAETLEDFKRFTRRTEK